MALLINVLVESRRRFIERLRGFNETLEQHVEERTAELERAQQAQRLAERLAAIGQMIAGISHESRNALQRLSTCHDLLRRRVSEQTQALPLIEEAEKPRCDLLQVYEEVRQYAAPIVLECQPEDIVALWRRAWEQLQPVREGRQMALVEQSNGCGTVCSLDRFRMEQVFRNLMENALASAPDPVQVSITLSDADCGGVPPYASSFATTDREWTRM